MLIKKLKKVLVINIFCVSLCLLASLVFAKDLVFPHVVINDFWNAGIALVNISDNDSGGNVYICTDGFVNYSFRILIPAHDRYYLSLEETGVYSIVIKGCKDDVYGTFIRVWNGQPIGEVNAIEIYR